MGMKPLWFLTLLSRGDVDFDMQICSMHWLRELVISCSLFCTYSHCVLVRSSCWSIFVRSSIARFCFSRKVVCRFWRF